MAQNHSVGVMFRAIAAGAVAVGSKVATMLKGAGGAGSIAKGLGGLAVGGGAAAAVMTSEQQCSQQQQQQQQSK